MTLYMERFEQHAVHGDLQKDLEQIEAIDTSKLDSRAASIVLRTGRVLTFARDLLQTLDVEFITPTMLQNLQKHIAALPNEIQACVDNGQWEALTNRGDNILQMLVNFFVPQPTEDSTRVYQKTLQEYRDFALGKLQEDKRELEEQVATFRETLGEHERKVAELSKSIERNQTSLGDVDKAVEAAMTARSEIEHRIQEVRSEMAELEGRCKSLVPDVETQFQKMLEEYKGRLDEWTKEKEAAWNDIQNQRNANFSDKLNEWSSAFNQAENSRTNVFTQSQNERATDFTERQSERMTQFEELLTKWEQSFNSREQKQAESFQQETQRRTAEFAELRERTKDEMKQVVQSLKDDAAEARSQEGAGASAHLTKLAEFEAEAKKIVGIIGNVGVTGNYQKIANRELRFAEIMRILSLLSFLVLGWTVWQIVQQVNADDFNWEVALFRLAVGLAFLGPAIYCARESSRHRTNEERNRRVELELASLGPYLEKLPDEKAKEVREALARLYFGNEPGISTRGGVRRLADVSLKDLSKELAPLVEVLKLLK